MTSDIAERGVCAAAALIRKDSPPWFSAEGTAAAQITAQTALTLGTMWAERRPMRASEATTFRVLGDLATRARLTEEEAIGAMEAGWDELLGVARGAISGGMWSPRTGKAALRELESEAQEFADRAATELRRGIAGEIGCACDRVGVLLRVLDGRLVGEELGAAASKAGLDASRPHGIVLLVDRFGRTGPLDMAAGEVASSTRPASMRPRTARALSRSWPWPVPPDLVTRTAERVATRRPASSLPPIVVTIFGPCTS